jgi:hypothetical protein
VLCLILENGTCVRPTIVRTDVTYSCIDEFHIITVLNIMYWYFIHTSMITSMYKYVNFISIGFLVVELVMINDENRFRVFEDQYMQIQIILNILCQFFAYTSTTVIINKYVNYMLSYYCISDDWWQRLISLFEESLHANSNNT